VWSASLILTQVPRGRLITGGPYAVVKHPLYSAAGLLVIPWVGFLLNTWLGAAIGVALYVGSRIFAPMEEASLSTEFGPRWEAYRRSVWVPWL
jgi:protein-S-isoprenylcysteine O-methyltransferase Ste14